MARTVVGHAVGLAKRFLGLREAEACDSIAELIERTVIDTPRAGDDRGHGWSDATTAAADHRLLLPPPPPPSQQRDTAEVREVPNPAEELARIVTRLFGLQCVADDDDDEPNEPTAVSDPRHCRLIIVPPTPTELDE